MQKRIILSDSWVALTNILSLILMYLVIVMPVFGLLWIATFGAIMLFGKVNDKEQRYVWIGIIGTVAFWGAVYVIVTYPELLIDTISYYLLCGILIAGIVLFAVWVVKRHQYLSRNLEA